MIRYLLAALVSMAPAVSMAGDVAAGRAIAQGRCSTCHGIDGIATMPIAPNLAAESEAYLVTQLKAFRSGRREHEIMSIVAGELTDTEIDDVASWYAAIRITATLPE